MSDSQREIDVEHLKGILDGLSKELAVTYLEKRHMQDSYGKNLVEDYALAVSEITKRERQLQAAVGGQQFNYLLERRANLLAERERLQEFERALRKRFLFLSQAVAL